MANAGMVIVGAGEAGGRAALTLREQGYHGRIVLLGAEQHPPYDRHARAGRAHGRA
jgi:NADPH-dependent 2,4-dienoyl-CoA reductase/sulfur reductase-like enzyme